MAAKKNFIELLEADLPYIESKEIIDYVESKRCEVLPITIKFTTGDNEVFTQSYAEYMKLSEIKIILGQVFNVSPSVIEIADAKGTLPDDKKISELNYSTHRTLNLQLRSTDRDIIISAKFAYKDFTLPDILTVTVTYEDGSSKDVVVEIENKAILKPYLGGYVHKITQIEYNHGYTQTGPAQPKIPAHMKNHRDTQTCIKRNRKVETMYLQATQMQNSNIYIPSVTDRIITPGPYETADEREARIDILSKVFIIQRYFRAWKLKKCVKAISDEYKKRLALEREEENYLSKMDEERKKCELIGKVFPRTKADFFMLYTMIENWKKAEIERIKNMSCGPSKIAEMYLLLEKEIQMLLSVESKKETVRRDRKIARDLKFLKTISEPISWNSDYKNIYIEMDTLKTQKGREYYEQYKAICDKSQGVEGRLKAYIDVKLSLKNHINCEVGLEIVNLIERACVLIARGISNSHLEILHKRIEASILRHMHVTDCCEGIALRNSKVQEQLMYGNTFFCYRCKRYKTYDKFEISTKTEALKVCSSCAWNDRVMEPWMDIQPYRYLLKCIRREERRQSSPSSIAFILTEKDIYHIVTQIWSSHSAISECNDIYKLRLCRFFKDEDWAPWNCILLTYEEAKAHLKVRQLETVYDPEFLAYIHNKHILSKRYFSVAIELHNYFQEIGHLESRWDEIIEKKEYVRTNSKINVYLKEN